MHQFKAVSSKLKQISVQTKRQHFSYVTHTCYDGHFRYFSNSILWLSDRWNAKGLEILFEKKIY